MNAHALPFLSDVELREIAAPLQQPAAITRWFQRSGFETRRKPNGMPLISRQNFEAVMSGRQAANDPTHGSADSEPDSAALRAIFSKHK
ncbi:hypothetical protein [Andreprevotia chitinilytica]|uniref:hypothetical protein n=1 Tax=Andreprevotia chitinilytica TaxID=396808 RepID=UPI0005509543|nr:hypothetical protein [Andreprevotia chitinilytica]